MDTITIPKTELKIGQISRRVTRSGELTNITFQTPSWNQLTSTAFSLECRTNDYWPEQMKGGPAYYDARVYQVFCFNTPLFGGVSKKLTLNLKLGYSPASMTIYGALTSRETNYGPYLDMDKTAFSQIQDDGQISTASTKISKYGSVNVAQTHYLYPISPFPDGNGAIDFSLNFETEKLKPGSTYYVVLWMYRSNVTSKDGIVAFWGRDYPVSIDLTYEKQGLAYIDNGTNVEPHQIYLDNGSTWDTYIPHIDTGTSWEICT